MRFILALLALLAGAPAYAQGTLPIALQQQFSFTGCTTAANACGTPLSGGLLYFYQAGTVATQQNSYQDTGLTILNPWPLTLDANGRVPPFYLANGSVHARLTDSSGVVQFDYPSLLVIGPSSGGGGGAGIDPTSIASTGDIKFRATSETLTGWVKINGQTIGNAISGATGRANSDTQSLFVYLWTNCSQAHCPVSSGSRGASALADFNANFTIQLLDWRARIPVGLDDMGNTAAGRMLASNITSGGGDGVTTPMASGGEANHTMTVNDLVGHTHAATIVEPNGGLGHSHGITEPNGGLGHGHTIPGNPNTISGGAFAANGNQGLGNTGNIATSLNPTGIAINIATSGVTLQDGFGHANVTQSAGAGQPFNQMQPFVLGSWYIKL